MYHNFYASLVLIAIVTAVDVPPLPSPVPSPPLPSPPAAIVRTT